MEITPAMINGTTEAHLRELPDSRCLLHAEVVEPWLALQSAAKQQGFDLQIASSFRSFDRQLAIWNGKASGERSALDDQSQPIDLDMLDDREKVFAILRWTGLPGASRHHWGTDMDVWDCSAVAEGYQLQLVPEEYQPSGPFAPLSDWLSSNATQFGFSRPYAVDKGGIAPEPWHLSYQPIARQFEQQLNMDALAALIDSTNMALKQAVLDNLDAIFQRFIRQ